ncbi:hypothetical protein ANCDUO_03064 [Ancylostoma duodenale]|uniref:Uncharacterized protein n=1 Tax=Ancylostoma duodenale TaxID=51022 RepID=A0A0C2HAS8_9BILA|nr:hypothetical protein ANCDUO_03064 [Ancylostoma duodenale]
MTSKFKSKNPEDPNEVPGGFLTDINKQPPIHFCPLSRGGVPQRRSPFLKDVQQWRARLGSELKAVSRASSRLVYCAAENSQWTLAQNVRECLMMECGRRGQFFAPAADALL